MITRHLFVSPHADDAVLSCGGTIALLTRLGRQVEVVTLFAGDVPQEPFSAFGERHLRLWGEENDPAGRRRAEDEIAKELLGVTLWHGLYPDAPFRRHPVDKRWLYTSDWALFRFPDPSEGDLPHRIAGEISTLVDAQTRVYVPLGLGNHVDHVLVAMAGRLLAQHGMEVVWYEDYPYAERDPRPERLSRRGWEAALVPLTPADVERKIQAILAYRSQILGLFGHEREVRRRVVDYMMTVSGRGYPAERFWRSPIRKGGKPHALR